MQAHQSLGHEPLRAARGWQGSITNLLDILYPGYVRRQNLHIGNVNTTLGVLG